MKKLSSILASALAMLAFSYPVASADELKHVRNLGYDFETCVQTAAGSSLSAMTSERRQQVSAQCTRESLPKANARLKQAVQDVLNRPQDEDAPDLPVEANLKKAVEHLEDFKSDIGAVMLMIMSMEKADIRNQQYQLAVTVHFTDIINDFAHKFDPGERDKEYLALRNRYTYRQYQQAFPGMDKCMKNATAMTEMYDCSGKAIKKQDEKLNKLYKKIMKRVGNDRHLKPAIKEMEVDWIKYKEAGAEFVSSTDTGSMVRLDAMDFVLESTMLQNELLELILDRLEND